jgi:hypothetical protein
MTNKSISRFSKGSLEHYSIASSTKEFLRLIGLPAWASPHLYFGDFEGVSLPRLQEWPWLSGTPNESSSNFIVIGCSGEDNPICINEANEEVYVLDQDQDFALVFMNSSALHLAAVLDSHAAMIEEAILTSGNEVGIENRIPESLINAFEKELHELDPAARAEGTFWANENSNLKQGLKKFRDLEKHWFELVGSVSDCYDSLRLKTVTIAADLTVLRALSEFVNRCASEIEQNEFGNWDHAHFRDDWQDWYSAYPDIIIVESSNR